jgi:hypothetical protein
MESLPFDMDAGRPIEVQAFSTRASPAWANHSDALKVGLKWVWSEARLHAKRAGAQREAGDKNWFLELVSL